MAQCSPRISAIQQGISNFVFLLCQELAKEQSLTLRYCETVSASAESDFLPLVTPILPPKEVGKYRFGGNQSPQ